MMIRSLAGVTLGFLISGGLALAGGAGRQVPQVAWPKFVADPSCIPELENGSLRLGTRPDLQISARMKVMFAADQADRQGAIDWKRVVPRDQERRKEVMGLLKAGKLVTGTDLLTAVLVFHHGECSNHHLLASALAGKALELDKSIPRWIYPETFDRYLVSINKLQKYGTQYATVLTRYNSYSGQPEGCDILEAAIDPSITDAERAKYGLSPLTQFMTDYSLHRAADLRDCRDSVEKAREGR